MVKKKSEDKKTKTKSKKITEEINIEVEKFPIIQLLEMNKIRPSIAVGFLNYYGLTGNFVEEYGNNNVVVEFSKGEFNDMYRRYIEREI